MNTVPIEEAQRRLAQIVGQLKPGEEVLITQQERTVARLVGERSGAPKPRRAGSAVGKLTIVDEDDEHLEDFQEYMP